MDFWRLLPSLCFSVSDFWRLLPSLCFSVIVFINKSNLLVIVDIKLLKALIKGSITPIPPLNISVNPESPPEAMPFNLSKIPGPAATSSFLDNSNNPPSFVDIWVLPSAGDLTSPTDCILLAATIRAPIAPNDIARAAIGCPPFENEFLNIDATAPIISIILNALAALVIIIIAPATISICPGNVPNTSIINPKVQVIGSKAEATIIKASCTLSTNFSIFSWVLKAVKSKYCCLSPLSNASFANSSKLAFFINWLDSWSDVIPIAAANESCCNTFIAVKSPKSPTFSLISWARVTWSPIKAAILAFSRLRDFPNINSAVNSASIDDSKFNICLPAAATSLSSIPKALAWVTALAILPASPPNCALNCPCTLADAFITPLNEILVLFSWFTKLTAASWSFKDWAIVFPFTLDCIDNAPTASPSNILASISLADVFNVSSLNIKAVPYDSFKAPEAA